MSTNKLNKYCRKSDDINTIIKIKYSINKIEDSPFLMKNKNETFTNFTTRVYNIQNYKLKAFALSIIILVNCIHLIDTNPVPDMKKSCGRSLSQRIYTICLNYGGICSFPTRIITRNHPNHRAKRRVVDECCRKACHDDFIQIYCCDAKQYRVIIDY